MALFGEDYVKFANYLKEGTYVFIRGKVQFRYKSEDQWELKPTSIQLLGDIAEKISKGVRLDLRLVNDMFIDKLEEVIKDSAGQKKLELYLYEPTENIRVEMFSRRDRVDPKMFIEKVKGWSWGLVSC